MNSFLTYIRGLPESLRLFSASLILVLVFALFDSNSLINGQRPGEVFERTFANMPMLSAIALFMLGTLIGVASSKKKFSFAWLSFLIVPIFSIAEIGLGSHRSPDIASDMLYVLIFFIPYYMGLRAGHSWT
jgi:uncharacterized membrane protein